MSADKFSEYLKRGARTAQQTIDAETVKHEKRVEFWKGYKSAMEEIRDHPELWPTQEGNHA